MARVPDEEIERLKKEVDLAELVVRSGVALKKAGGDLVGLLPVPRRRHPLAGGHAEQNLWHCMGACQVGGSAIDWVMRTQGVSFRHAVELLRAGAAPLITPGPDARPWPRGPRRGSCLRRSTPRPRTRRCSPRSSTTTTPPLASLPRPWPTWHAARSTTRVITRFRLGYANRTLGYRLPSKQTKEGGAVRARLDRPRGAALVGP